MPFGTWSHLCVYCMHAQADDVEVGLGLVANAFEFRKEFASGLRAGPAWNSPQSIHYLYIIINSHRALVSMAGQHAGHRCGRWRRGGRANGRWATLLVDQDWRHCFRSHGMKLKLVSKKIAKPKIVHIDPRPSSCCRWLGHIGLEGRAPGFSAGFAT